MKWILIVAAIVGVGWAALSITPYDLMSSDCKALTLKAKADNEYVQQMITAARRGPNVTVDGLRGKALVADIEHRQFVVQHDLWRIENKRCEAQYATK